MVWKKGERADNEFEGEDQQFKRIAPIPCPKCKIIMEEKERNSRIAKLECPKCHFKGKVEV